MTASGSSAPRNARRLALFGGGADGTTIESTDGGFFFALARHYEAHPLAF